MRRKEGFLALLLAASLLLSACGGGLTAATMHLRKTAGEVRVSDEEAKTIPLADNLGLYSGYQLDTGSESYAWIDLDKVKLVKMDEDSQTEIKKEGKDLEIIIRSGSVFFNVTEPLEDGETMTIRTADLLVGIRGTCGWVDAERNLAALLEGQVRCETEAGEEASVSAGEKVVLNEDGQLTVSPLTARDIPAFVLAELEEDEALCQEILDGTGIDVLNLPPIVRSGQSAVISNNYSVQAVVKADGTLWMKGYGIWGNNTFLWGSTNVNVDEFILIRENVSAVCLNSERAGGSDVPYSTTAVIDGDGVLWMWGDGALGDGIRSWERTSGDPVRVMEHVQAVSMGHSLTAILQTDGSLWALGILGNADYWSPVKIMDDVAAVSTCGSTTAVIKNDGSLWMWGSNDRGQLGIGTTEGDTAMEWGGSYQSTPVKVMDDVAAVSVSLYHTAAIKTDGTLWTWGFNDCGQLGNGGQSNGTVTEGYVEFDFVDYDESYRTVVQPIQTQPVKVMDGVQAVCTSIGNTDILLEDGSLWHCGISENGTETAIHTSMADMVYGSEVSIWSTPVKVQKGGVAGLSAGMILKRDGTVWQNGELIFEGAAVPAAQRAAERK